jgi:HAD superfamily hydrolase (TIGR01509 family)
MPQAIFFDFDGVILETADIKTDAFGELYREHGPELMARVRDYHVRHGGLSRFFKIRLFEREWLGRPADEAREAALAQRFADLVLDKVLAAPPLPGALECLERLNGQLPLFVVSGTPEDELRHICAVRGFDRLFSEVHGAPRRKPEILASICAAHGLDAARCVMVGDATTDYDAAMAHGMGFIGVVPPGGRNLFPPGTAIREDLRGLADVLSRY